jgi:hypothetical protein
MLRFRLSNCLSWKLQRTAMSKIAVGVLSSAFAVGDISQHQQILVFLM